MITMEELRTKAFEKSQQLLSRSGSSYLFDMAEMIDYMIDNFPQENQPEKAEPKPRWKSKTDSDTYTVREVDDGWEIWLVSKRSGLNRKTKNLGMNETYSSEQKAIDALDEWCATFPTWERCDEEDSDKEILEEIRKLREQLGFGYIFGNGDGLWGIKNYSENGVAIVNRHTLPELRSILRKKAEPEPVTREQLEESVDYLHDETSNDHVAHHHYDRAKRFIGELK